MSFHLLPTKDTGRNKCADCCGNRIAYLKRFRKDRFSYSAKCPKPKTLLLTAQYRNHYYIEKLLGNLIGLGRLMAYIAKETETQVGNLTVVSTHATIDLPQSASRQDFLDLIERCQRPPVATKSAA